MRYNLRDMLNKATTGTSKFVLKEGVNYHFISGKEKNIIRFLPAFDPENDDKETSFLPCINENDEITPFVMPIMVARNLGHGTNAAAKKNILSLATFGEPCPIDKLYQVARDNPEEWGYLLSLENVNGEWKKKANTFADLSAPSAVMLANIINVVEDRGVQIGIFSKSAMTNLIGPKGLIFQRNTQNVSEEQLKENYLLGYAHGDITDPVNGPCLVIQKGTDRGAMSDFNVDIAMSGRNVKRRKLTAEEMASRYDLTDPESILDIKSEEEIIAELVEIYNGRSPSGIPETALLREAFPYYNGIPEEKTTVVKPEVEVEPKEDTSKVPEEKSKKEKASSSKKIITETLKNISEEEPKEAESSSEKEKVPGDGYDTETLMKILAESGIELPKK